MLTVHVASSVGSLGAIGVFLMFAVTGVMATDNTLIRAAYVAMCYCARLVVLPLLFAAVTSGIIQSLGTRWGLIRHYWVIAKLTLSALAIVVFLLQFDVIAYLEVWARQSDLRSAAVRSLQWRPVIHSALGLLVMLVPVALSIYKPAGLTPFGWRRCGTAPNAHA